MENTKALATLEKQGFELIPFSPEIRDIVKEEMEGMGAVSFDAIKIPSGGSLAFEIPGEDPDRPETVSEIVGIVVSHNAVNAYWQDKFSGDNTPPDCSSDDGKTGIEATGEFHDCASCPRNAFGSGEDGVGKACKNMRKIYIVRSGNPLPYVLLLPPTSLKPWKDYLSKQVVFRGKRVSEVLTRVTLKKEKSKDGITYSQAAFSKVADLTPEETAYLKPFSEALKSMISGFETEAPRFVEIHSAEELEG